MDDLDSNVSLQSISSVIGHDTTIEQPKYFDRKRRLLAAEQQISGSENDVLVTKKASPHKKACLDDIVDSLNQKAQAERDEEDEQENIDNDEHKKKQEPNDDDEEIVVQTNNNVVSPSIATEREDEYIDVDDAKPHVDDDH